jgi:predicted DNA-binding transcriptional regulator AlpA
MITAGAGELRRIMEKYLSIDEVCERVPGMTRGLLAQMRYRGDGPRYVKASPRTVVYAEAAIEQWLKSREQQSTGEAVGA